MSFAPAHVDATEYRHNGLREYFVAQPYLLVIPATGACFKHAQPRIQPQNPPPINWNRPGTRPTRPVAAVQRAVRLPFEFVQQCAIQAELQATMDKSARLIAGKVNQFA